MCFSSENVMVVEYCASDICKSNNLLLALLQTNYITKIFFFFFFVISFLRGIQEKSNRFAKKIHLIHNIHFHKKSYENICNKVFSCFKIQKKKKFY